MSIWVSLFIADFINNLVMSSLFIREYKNKNGNISFKMLIYCCIAIIIITTLSIFLFRNTSKMIKTIIKILISSVFFRSVFKEKIPKILMKIFLIYILFAIYDTMFGLFYIGILQIPTKIFNSSPYYTLMGNIIIASCTYITLRKNKVVKFIENIAEWYSTKSIMNLIVNIILCVVILWFFINKNTNGSTPLYEYIINFSVIAIIIVFVIGFFKENSDKNQLKRKYDSLIDYAKTYEQEVIEKSKWQHEYENQLILIRDIIKKQTSNQAINYINDLLKNKPTDENVEWLTKLSQFPDIGIKGLLHYKICQMKELNINVFVDVTNDVVIKKNSKASSLLEDNLQDISRILGVYLDNAMQAAEKSFNKYIVLEFKSTKNEIIFEISNTYGGKLEVERLGQENFTTKGSGHGYGLSLAKDILNRNIYLSEKKEINGMYYVQKLIIDIKK